jgi:adhesin transport system membrane fusion protein
MTELPLRHRASDPFAPWSMRVDTNPARKMLAILGVATLLFLGWASLFSIDQITRGSGRVLPSVQNQLVQHLEGGIVGQILVREGDRVREGQVLLRLANRFTGAELANAQTDVTAKRIALARMEAEARGANDFAASPELAARAPEIAASEEVLFRSRRNAIDQQLSVADDQIRATRAELATLRARLDNLRSEERLQLTQLAAFEKALAADAISANEVLERRTSLQQLRTRLADVSNAIPQSLAEMAEAEGRRRETWAKFVSENSEKAAALRLELSKAGEALGAYRDRRTRQDVRAPLSGIVNKLFVQTVGGVARAGEPLIEIVPVEKAVMVEARIAPKDRSRVWPGQPAVVKLSAYDFAVYGGLDASVLDVSPDVLQDPKGEVFYRVRLRADTAKFGSDKPVIPGMTAEVNIRSGRQTIMQYLLAPVHNVADNALRE